MCELIFTISNYIIWGELTEKIQNYLQRMNENPLKIEDSRWSEKEHRKGKKEFCTKKKKKKQKKF